MLLYTDEYIKDVRCVLKEIPNLHDIRNKRVLITGANGLIGSAVVDLLLEANKFLGYNVEIYAAGRSKERMDARFKDQTNHVYFHFVEYHAEQPLAFDLYFDYIIHCASNANPMVYVNEPVETLWNNLLGTKNLLDYMKQGKARRFLYVSSSEVYGNKDSKEPYSEQDYGYLDLLNPRACYPSSKRAAETLCASYLKEYNVDYVIVRPGHVYGPSMTDNDNRAASQFARDVKNGHDIVMKSAGRQLRSYCYSLDCASAIVSVLLNGKKENAYNISNRDSVVTIKQMAECFAQAADRKIVVEAASEDEKAGYNLMENSSLCARKLESLGWRGKFDMITGAKHTLNSMK